MTKCTAGRGVMFGRTDSPDPTNTPVPGLAYHTRAAAWWKRDVRGVAFGAIQTRATGAAKQVENNCDGFTVLFNFRVGRYLILEFTQEGWQS